MYKVREICGLRNLISIACIKRTVSTPEPVSREFEAKKTEIVNLNFPA
jgi:hypothetical protein